MNEILINILSVIVTAVILPLISFAGTRLITFLNGKIKDQKAKTFIADATNIITSAVRTVFQTYVDSLKKAGSFDKDAQLLALNKAKDLALSQMSTELKDYISKNYGDLNSWITSQIEATIDLLKN